MEHVAIRNGRNREKEGGGEMNETLHSICLSSAAGVLSLTDIDDVEVIPVRQVELGIVWRQAEDLLAVAVAGR